MACEVNVAENVDVFEVYNTKVFDQAPIDPQQVQALLKAELNHRVQAMLNQLLIREVDDQLLARRYERQDGRRGRTSDANASTCAVKSAKSRPTNSSDRCSMPISCNSVICSTSASGVPASRCPAWAGFG